jgi:hypothetical protein
VRERERERERCEWKFETLLKKSNGVLPGSEGGWRGEGKGRE